MSESWDLLDAIREFVSREGWEQDVEAIERLETRIGEAVGEIDADAPLQAWRSALMSSDPLPFLRSRDAAAMLEEALANTTNCDITFRGSTSRLPHPEPVARTLAVLEAGHRLGLWPVKT